MPFIFVHELFKKRVDGENQNWKSQNMRSVLHETDIIKHHPENVDPCFFYRYDIIWIDVGVERFPKEPFEEIVISGKGDVEIEDCHNVPFFWFDFKAEIKTNDKKNIFKLLSTLWICYVRLWSGSLWEECDRYPHIWLPGTWMPLLKDGHHCL